MAENEFVIKKGLVVGQDVEVRGTGSVKLPAGTTAQRPTPTAGMIRFNTTAGEFEGYNGSSWSLLGYTGSIGFTGSRGFTGSVGFTGSQGIQGIQGTTGFTGSIGFTGSQGVQGVTGFTGSIGFVGSRGFTGSQGIQGVTGFTGSRGATGTTGFTGSQGFTGTTGFTGSVGAIGATGSQGIQGITGFTGSQGIQGVTGFTGSIGFVGSRGFTGSVGNTGATGFTGSQGIQGVTGFVGSQGPSTAINATNDTSATTHYPVFVAAADSNQTPRIRTTATALSYVPSTGTLATTTFAAGDGSVSAPSYDFASDPDTGIYRSAINTLAITTGGTQAATFDANGNTNIAGGIGVRAGSPSTNSSAVLSYTLGHGNTSRYGIYNLLTIDNTTGALTADRNSWGIFSQVETQVQNDAAFSHILYGGQFTAKTGVAGGNSVDGEGVLFGLQGYAHNDSDDITFNRIESAYGVYGIAQATGDTSIIDNAYGVFGRIRPTVAGATINTGYMFYGDHGAVTGTFTNRWGVYINNPVNNYFAGGAQIGGTATGSTTAAGLGVGTAPAGAGRINMTSQLTNTVATGTAPFVVSSTTRVANLNVATAGTADNVANSLVLKFGSGTTEGTDQYTFNGSAAKTVDIREGTNVTLTETAGVVTISSTNTTYSAGSGIELTGTTFFVAGGNGLVQETSGLALGTPSTLTGSTTNTVTATSHTHAISVNLDVINGNSAGPIITCSAGTNVTIPTASTSASGVVTTGAQTWAGAKTFNSGITAPSVTSTAALTLTSGSTNNVNIAPGGTTIGTFGSAGLTVVGDIATVTAAGGIYAGTVNTDSNSTRGWQALNNTGIGLVRQQCESTASDTGNARLLYKGTTLTNQILVNGNIRNLNNVYGQLSDERLKEEITPANPQLDDLRNIEIVNFKFKNQTNPVKMIGVIAQQLQQIKPGLVETDEDGMLAVKYSVLNLVAIKALQELADKVDLIVQEIENLKSSLT